MLYNYSYSMKTLLLILFAIPLVAFYIYNIYASVEWFVFGHEFLEGTSALALTNLVTAILLTLLFVLYVIRKKKNNLRNV